MMVQTFTGAGHRVHTCTELGAVVPGVAGDRLVWCREALGVHSPPSAAVGYAGLVVAVWLGVRCFVVARRWRAERGIEAGRVWVLDSARGAVDLVRSLAGYRPTSALERSVPRSVESSWQTELGHQASNLSSPDDCLDRFRLALEQLDG